MDDDAGKAQAQALLHELHGHVAEISNKLEAADERNRRARLRGIPRKDPTAGILRRELHEAHRLIDGLHNRYPDAVKPPTDGDELLAATKLRQLTSRAAFHE